MAIFHFYFTVCPNSSSLGSERLPHGLIDFTKTCYFIPYEISENAIIHDFVWEFRKFLITSRIVPEPTHAYLDRSNTASHTHTHAFAHLSHRIGNLHNACLEVKAS